MTKRDKTTAVPAEAKPAAVVKGKPIEEAEKTDGQSIMDYQAGFTSGYSL